MFRDWRNGEPYAPSRDTPCPFFMHLCGISLKTINIVNKLIASYEMYKWEPRCSDDASHLKNVFLGNPRGKKKDPAEPSEIEQVLP